MRYFAVGIFFRIILAVVTLSVLCACDGFIKKSDSNQSAASNINAIGCSLFDHQGKLLKKYSGWVCAFFPNGHMLLGDGFTLTFYDPGMRPLWSKDMHSHHMITFDRESNTAAVIASHIVNGSQRYDRLEVYGIDGNLLSEFNFMPKHSVAKVPQNWDFPVFPYVKQSLTVVESFYRIGKNSSKLPFLTEGNFIAYDAAGIIYFFDSKLKEIVHQVKVREVGLNSEIRDLQITPEGNLLFYNSGNRLGGKRYTSIDEVDPESWKTLWSFKGDPPTKFYGKYEGNVQRLPNGHYLFSVVTDEANPKSANISRDEFEKWMDVMGHHRSYEVTREGRIVWEMSNDGGDLSGIPNVIKRYELADYFRHKGRY